MKGLLYKDFAELRGGWILSATIAAFLFLVVLCMATGGSGDAEVMLPWLIGMFVVVFAILTVFVLDGRLVRNDEGKKQREYILSLPLSRQQYVLSKYLFLLLAVLAAMLLCGALVLIAGMCVDGDTGSGLLKDLGRAIVPLFSGGIILCSIEMPIFMLYGVKKGNAIKTSIFILLTYVFVIYLLVGNLDMLERFQEALFSWYDGHKNIFKVLLTVLPYVASAMYVGSFLLTSKLFGRKEREE